jgi:putative ATPase
MLSSYAPQKCTNCPDEMVGLCQKYQYDPAEVGGVALTQTCFPDQLGGRTYYQPTGNGLESKVKDKLDQLREKRSAALRDKTSKPQ